jgi:hypothetical protein
MSSVKYVRFVLTVGSGMRPARVALGAPDVGSRFEFPSQIRTPPFDQSMGSYWC